MTALRGCLEDLRLRRRYSTGRHDITREFFVPCLERAVAYDRAVGYFSSTFYALIDVPLAAFAEAGGRVRLVCSPQLSAEDIEAISHGYERRALEGAVVRELDALVIDPAGEAAAALLGTLIVAGVMDIKLAFNRNERGIFHDKVGIFADPCGHQVSFTGSANETWSAWSGLANHESFHAFTSWTPEGAEHVAEDVESFASLWQGHESSVEVVDFPDVARDRLVEKADPEGLRAAQQRLAARVSDRPPRPTLRDHQGVALEQWRDAGFRGLLEHATGSGKTITALSAIDRAVHERRPVVVLVPSRTLLHQWKAQVRGFFGAEIRLLLAGDRYDQWKQGSVLRDFLSDPDRGSIVVATMDTAASEPFLKRVADTPRLMLVADEVHRLGSPRRRAVFGIGSDWRLGLSATWRREGDPEGSDAILGYFERVLEPPYTLADAIHDGHLCGYRYLIHELDLDEDERNQWLDLSRRIGRAIAQAGGEVSESARQLMIQRARIIKGARGKVALALGLLEREYQAGEAWLVYCDDTVQLRALKDACSRRDIHAFEYHTNMIGEADVALDEFAAAGGIMLSINCLDEGVDIPRISHALILASSTTRREFIQRRGRVLRQHETKRRAVIHDLLVRAGSFDDPEAATFVRTELARATEFAMPAVDSNATIVRLERLASEAGVTLAAPEVGEGIEDEESEPE